jgi:hypothetical protein
MRLPPAGKSAAPANCLGAGERARLLARQSRSDGLIGQVGVGEVRRKGLLPAGASPTGPTAIAAIVQLAHDLDRSQDAHQRVEVGQDLTPWSETTMWPERNRAQT